MIFLFCDKSLFFWLSVFLLFIIISFSFIFLGSLTLLFFVSFLFNALMSKFVLCGLFLYSKIFFILLSGEIKLNEELLGIKLRKELIFFISDIDISSLLCKVLILLFPFSFNWRKSINSLLFFL